MAEMFELGPVEGLVVTTLGDPGQRRFFLQAQHSGQVLTLACEKFHIQGLVARIDQLLEAQAAGEDPHGTPILRPEALGPVDPLWSVAEMGLGYHEGRRQFVIVARELVEEGEGATVRVWADRDRIWAFARQAEEVLAGGRPVCPRCGLPIDPGGHPCPASNGSRPIF